MLKDLYHLGLKLTPNTNDLFCKRYIFAAEAYCLLYHMHQTGAARHLHTSHRYTLDVGRSEDIGKFGKMRFEIIQLGTCDQKGVILQQILMEIGIGKWHAVGGQQ